MLRAKAIITLSNHAKREIATFYPSVADRVYSIYLAAHPRFRLMDKALARQQIEAAYQVRGEFLLVVGNLQPRKNLLRVVRAFSSVVRKHPQIKLVIVGKAQWQSSDVYKLVDDLGIGDKIVFTGYVSDNDLVALYNAATAFLYTSLYEGFGLPILEAMACGTPVITSNTASMPEAAGDDALLVDPYQHEEIAQAVLQLLDNPALANSLVERGLKRAKSFTWEKTAAETAEVYRMVQRQSRKR